MRAAGARLGVVRAALGHGHELGEEGAVGLRGHGLGRAGDVVPHPGPLLGPHQRGRDALAIGQFSMVKRGLVTFYHSR